MGGLWDTYLRGTEDTRQTIKEEYERHISEKEEVRRLKDLAKERASRNNTFNAAVFDLQQVIYMPKSPRSELFFTNAALQVIISPYMSLLTKRGIAMHPMKVKLVGDRARLHLTYFTI